MAETDSRDIFCVSEQENGLLTVPQYTVIDDSTSKPGDTAIDKEMKRYRYENTFIGLRQQKLNIENCEIDKFSKIFDSKSALNRQSVSAITL